VPTLRIRYAFIAAKRSAMIYKHNNHKAREILTLQYTARCRIATIGSVFLFFSSLPSSSSSLSSLILFLFCSFYFLLFFFLLTGIPISCLYTRTDKFKYFTRTNFGVTSLADNYYYYYYVNIIIINAMHTVLSFSACRTIRRVRSFSHSACLSSHSLALSFAP